MKKKILSIFLALAIILSCGNFTVFASEVKNDCIGEEQTISLMENQKEEKEEQLEKSRKVIKTTLSMEIDMLAEIEAFLAYSEDELIAMGATKEKIDRNKEELLYYYTLSVSNLAKKLKINEIEAEMFKRAIEAGLNSNSKIKKHKNGVLASGSITASEMKYEQEVTDNSTSTNPSYDVKLSYEWKEVYALAILDDKIAVAWGGGLNTKNISSSAYYHNWENVGGSFGNYYTRRSMNEMETVQAGIEFEFPQAIYKDVFSYMPKTKDGFAKFTLYQTKYMGYDTKIISHYCHKVITFESASIEISASGAAVSLSIGPAYHTTAQARDIIGY